MSRTRRSVSWRIVVSATSSGSGIESSAMKCPNSDSSSSPTGFSSETGVCALRRICSTSSTSRSSSRAISSEVGSRPSSARSLRSVRAILFSFSTTCTGIRIVPRLVCERPCHGLADPPGRVRGELEAVAVVEFLGRANEPDRALLDQVEKRQALVAVVLRDRDDEAEVRLDHRLLRRVVASLDALGELDLLRGRQERHLADVLQKQLQRVGRDLADRRRRDRPRGCRRPR